MERSPEIADVGLGLLRWGGRRGLAVARVTLAPARLVLRVPMARDAAERARVRLAADGRELRERTGRQLTAFIEREQLLTRVADYVLQERFVRPLAEYVERERLVEQVTDYAVQERFIVQIADFVQEILSRPDVQVALDRMIDGPVNAALDRALAGPLTDAVAQAVASNDVIERVAVPVVDSIDVEALVDTILADPRTRTIVMKVAGSDFVSELTERSLASAEMQHVIDQIASSPAVRAAVTQHTEGLAGEVVADVRTRSERADESVERAVRRVLRRPRTDAT